MTGINRIEGNAIIYSDHMVVYNTKFTTNQHYMVFMADMLSPNGDARQHARELRYMNNDGTWGIKRLK